MIQTNKVKAALGRTAADFKNPQFRLPCLYCADFSVKFWNRGFSSVLAVLRF
jgi:hypothetical protein